MTQIIAPHPVTDITPKLDAENITLEWPRPEGRIDSYYVTWFPLDSPDDIRVKIIDGDVETEGIDRTVRVLIDGLRPGVNYNFEIHTMSHNLQSAIVHTTIRSEPLCTSDLFIINNQEVNIIKALADLYITGNL